MAFRVKDLMISIIPKEGDDAGSLGCPPATLLCEAHSPTGGNQYGLHAGPHIFCEAGSHTAPYMLCGCPIVFCPPQSHQPTCLPRSMAAGLIPVAFAGDPALAAEQLSALKSQLKEAIEEIEAQEKVVAERSRPQSAADIDSLLTKLEEAKAELQQKKSDLEQG
jgi:hypothetical protein